MLMKMPQFRMKRSRIFWASVSLMTLAASLVIVFGTGFGAGSTDDVLPTVPKALAVQAGTNISAAKPVVGNSATQAAIEKIALNHFQDAKIRESAIVWLDDDVVRPTIHSDVWAVSLALPQGDGILPNPQTGEWTKVTYFLAIFDVHTGEFLFAESQ